MTWHDLFSYDVETGVLRNKVKRNSRAKEGEKAGSINDSGYLVTRIKGKPVRVHRIIWEMHFGAIDAGLEIDHINRIRCDNRIENLRLASSHEQNLNLGPRRSASSVTGVVFSKKTQRWQAQIGFKGKHIYLGQFVDKEEAVVARKAAEREYSFRRQQ